ncbi:MAG: response regulator, partial [Alphaproteobacteria bacterium]|nr:response regulator [Alphaproteobacteria bacterium]
MERRPVTGPEAPPRGGLRLPLRLHILILFLALIGVIALILGSVVSRTSRDLVDQTVSASFIGSAELALQELARMEETARAAAEALAAHPITRATTEQDRAGQIFALATILQAVPGVSATYVGWPNGDFVLLRPVDLTIEQLGVPDGAVWLAQWINGEDSRFDFLDAGLALVESRDNVNTSFDPRTRPWFIEAMETAETILTAPYIFYTTRDPGITAARRADSGAVAGVDVSLWDLSARLPQGRPVPETQAAVIDRTGGVLAYSGAARLREIVEADQKANAPVLIETLPSARLFDSAILSALTDRAGTTAQTYFGPVEAGGVTWLTVIKTLNDDGTSFVMAAPLEALGSGPRAIRVRLLQVLGLAMILAVPVIWIAARILARPVEAFAKDVERITQMDFVAPPPLQTRIAELAALDGSIHAMRLTLRERLKELHCLYQVLELTADTNRPVPDICTDIAEILATSLLHTDSAMARIVLAGQECRCPDWQPPAVSISAPIHPDRPDAGYIEVGYTAGSEEENPFLQEEHALIKGVAAHIARLQQNRQMVVQLTQSERLSAVGQLTGGVAHDFNNLLTVILGNAELLSERLTDQELRSLADMTASAAERGAQLTRRLLAFARQQALQPRHVDVNKLLAEMEGLLRRTLSANIDIRIIQAEDLWIAEVDPGQLDAALLNLAINARDAMPDGGCLTIETANAVCDGAYVASRFAVEPGPYVMISVSDTGTGMTPKVAARAFDPFFTTKEIGKGSGLGLSMVYGFLTQSHGHVHLYSEPGHGTTVKLYLPRAAGTRIDEPSPSHAAPATGSERILLVEDDDLVRDNVQRQLVQLGYDVLAVRNGQKALEALQGDAGFDLLFTDIVMPGGLNGRQL